MHMPSPLRAHALTEALRQRLHHEVHARPPEVLQAPLAITHLAMLVDDESRSASRAQLVALLQASGLPAPDPDAVFVRAELGRFRLRWELHTEFVAWTLMRPLDADEAAALAQGEPLTALELAPPAWRAALPGRQLAGVQLWVLPRQGLDSGAVVRRLLDEGSVTGSTVISHSSHLHTDMQLHADGCLRMLVFTGEVAPERHHGLAGIGEHVAERAALGTDHRHGRLGKRIGHRLEQRAPLARQGGFVGEQRGDALGAEQRVQQARAGGVERRQAVDIHRRRLRGPRLRATRLRAQRTHALDQRRVVRERPLAPYAQPCAALGRNERDLAGAGRGHGTVCRLGTSWHSLQGPRLTRRRLYNSRCPQARRAGQSPDEAIASGAPAWRNAADGRIIPPSGIKGSVLRPCCQALDGARRRCTEMHAP